MYIEVYTPEDLYNVRNNPSGDYIQMADIDLSSYVQWSPIPEFYGTYNGNGYKITGLNISGSYVGLFYYVDTAAKIININIVNGYAIGYEIAALLVTILCGEVTNCYVSGEVFCNYVAGGLVVYSYGGKISGCISEVNLTSGDTAGGIAAGTYDYSIISDCGASGNIEITSASSGDAGCLIGRVENCQVNNCYATGNITCKTAGDISDRVFAGGLCGYTSYSILQKCYTTGTVSVENHETGAVGGFAAVLDECEISQCCCFAGGAGGGVTVTGGYAGGFVGIIYNSKISNCYNDNLISGTGEYIGGFTSGVHYWSVYPEIYNCYSACNIEASANYTMGAFIGFEYSEVSIISSYFDVDRAGTSDQFATPKTTAQMKQQATFAGWDFTYIWNIVENVTYPYLFLHSFSCRAIRLLFDARSAKLVKPIKGGL